MASTYTPIATTTIGSAQASVTFNSISGYTDLVLVASIKTSTGYNPLLAFNSDTGTNYSMSQIYGYYATGANSNRLTNNAGMYIGEGSSTDFVFYKIDLMNYANTTTYKNVLFSQNQANILVERAVGLWRNTAAITSVQIYVNGGGNLSSGSTMTLYGVKAA